MSKKNNILFICSLSLIAFASLAHAQVVSDDTSFLKGVSRLIHNMRCPTKLAAVALGTDSKAVNYSLSDCNGTYFMVNAPIPANKKIAVPGVPFENFQPGEMAVQTDRDDSGTITFVEISELSSHFRGHVIVDVRANKKGNCMARIRYESHKEINQVRMNSRGEQRAWDTETDEGSIETCETTFPRS